MFQGIKGRGTFALHKRMFHAANIPRSKSYTNESSLCVLFAPGNESAEEREVSHS